MSGELHRLANGLTVAVDPMPGAESVAIGLYAQVGSRSEPDHLSGLAHLVEHMVFKGAGSRDTRALAEAIEDVGGAINAWTARDQTVFYGRTLAKDAELLCEILTDMVRSPHLAEEHLEREKDVILSELGEVMDSPDDLVHEQLFEAAFDGQPLGRSVLGRAETLRAIRRDDILRWIEGELVPSRLILAASGKVDCDRILKCAERLIGDLEDWPGVPIGRAEFTGGVRNDRREFEQAHWSLALPGLPAADPHLPALSIFVQALGGGMSSRLFQELREERGLAYSVSAWQQAYADTGIVAMSCAADRTRAGERNTKTRGGEGAAGGKHAEGAVETPQGRADHMARSIEVFGRILGTGEVLDELRAVDAAAAKAAGAATLVDGRAAIASVGASLALAA